MLFVFIFTSLEFQMSFVCLFGLVISFENLHHHILINDTYPKPNAVALNELWFTTYVWRNVSVGSHRPASYTASEGKDTDIVTLVQILG